MKLGRIVNYVTDAICRAKFDAYIGCRNYFARSRRSRTSITLTTLPSCIVGSLYVFIETFSYATALAYKTITDLDYALKTDRPEADPAELH